MSSYYKTADGRDLMEIVGELSFNRGNVIKYVFRAGKKSQETEYQDLCKAMDYLLAEIFRVGKDQLSEGVKIELKELIENIKEFY